MASPNSLIASTSIQEHHHESEEETLAIFTSKAIKFDENNQARNIRLCSCLRPHMRGFHLSWLGFFLAFTSWFAFAPLMPSVRESLNLTKDQIGNANIASIASTIIFRVIVGPLCDKFGARRVFAIMLTLGAIPACFAGFVNSATGLVVIRACIGTIGSVFVPCQMWTTQMFSPAIVGTANAMAGGWGNLGGGFTFILMPQIFNMFGAFGLGADMAWRVSFIIPGCACLVVAALMTFCADDAPPPPTSSSAGGNEYAQGCVESEDEVEKVGCLAGIKSVIANPTVWFLIFIYGMCFGVELAVNNMIGLYFFDHFKRPNCDPALVEDECRMLTQSTAGLIASLFGLMNLFARGIGGYTSDRLGARFGIKGRQLTLFITLALEAVFLFLFQSQRTIPTAIVTLVMFSSAVQMSEGATYGVVPFVDPTKRFTGSIAGLVGAGGNLGGVACATIFKTMEIYAAFQTIAVMCGIAAATVLLTNVQGHRLIYFFTLNPVEERAKLKGEMRAEMDTLKDRIHKLEAGDKGGRVSMGPDDKADGTHISIEM